MYSKAKCHYSSSNTHDRHLYPVTLWPMTLNIIAPESCAASREFCCSDCQIKLPYVEVQDKKNNFMPHSRSYGNSWHARKTKSELHLVSIIWNNNWWDLVKGWFKTDSCLFLHKVYKPTVAVQVQTSLGGFHLGMSHFTWEKRALTNPKWTSEGEGEENRRADREELEHFLL